MIFNALIIFLFFLVFFSWKSRRSSNLGVKIMPHVLLFFISLILLIDGVSIQTGQNVTNITGTQVYTATFTDYTTTNYWFDALATVLFLIASVGLLAEFLEFYRRSTR